MKSKSIYFKFKEDVNVKDLADIIEKSWVGGAAQQYVDSLKKESQRHFVFKDHSQCCPEEGCYYNNDVNGNCSNPFCKRNN